MKKGDSLSEIAEKHHMKVGELIALQKGSLRKRLDAEQVRDLRPGDELTIMIDRGIIAAFAPTKDEDRGVLRVGIPLDPGTSTITSSARTWPSGQARRSRRSRPRSRSTRCSRASRAGRRSDVGDISARGGGPLKGHKSHQKGVDVDVRPGAQGGRRAARSGIPLRQRRQPRRRAHLGAHQVLRRHQGGPRDLPRLRAAEGPRTSTPRRRACPRPSSTSCSSTRAARAAASASSATGRATATTSTSASTAERGAVAVPVMGACSRGAGREGACLLGTCPDGQKTMKPMNGPSCSSGMPPNTAVRRAWPPITPLTRFAGPVNT